MGPCPASSRGYTPRAAGSGSPSREPDPVGLLVHSVQLVRLKSGKRSSSVMSALGCHWIRAVSSSVTRLAATAPRIAFAFSSATVEYGA